MGNSPDFASVIGGYFTSFDKIPSIVLAGCFALSLIPWTIRMFNKDTRMIIPLINAIILAGEHTIIWSLRASDARGNAQTAGSIPHTLLVYYFQCSLSTGYSQLAASCAELMKAMIVNTTLADPKRGSIDQPEARANYRYLVGRIGLAYWIVFGLGTISGSLHGLTTNTTTVILFRYASAILGIAVMGWQLWLLFSWRNVPFYDPKAARVIYLVMGILLVIPIYRLFVMWEKTPYYPGTSSPETWDNHSLTSNGAKAAFYILHALPELAAAVLLLSLNLRSIFNTGKHGDYLRNDKKHMPWLRVNGVHVDGVGVKMAGTEASALKAADIESQNYSQDGLLQTQQHADPFNPPVSYDPPSYPPSFHSSGSYAQVPLQEPRMY